MQTRSRRSEAAKKDNQVALRKRGAAGSPPPASDEVILRTLLFRLHAFRLHAFGAARLDDDQSIGLTHGGANTRLHAFVDTRGRDGVRVAFRRPTSWHLTTYELVAGLFEATILADVAYDADAFRHGLDSLGLGARIPPKGDPVNPFPYQKGHYRRRHGRISFKE